MTTVDSELIRELLSLYVKYGAAEFEAAARALRRGDVTRAIAEAAEGLGSSARARNKDAARGAAHRGPVAAKSQEELTEFFHELDNLGTKKSRDISDLGRKILKKETLKTSRSLREYMLIIGIPVGDQLPRRIQAAHKISKYLMDLPEREVSEKLELLQSVADNGSSLQKWADIIVRSE